MKPLHLLVPVAAAAISLTAASSAIASPWLDGDLADYCNTQEIHNPYEETYSHSEGHVLNGEVTPSGSSISSTSASNTIWGTSSADLISSRDCSAVVHSAANVYMFETQLRSSYLMNLLAW